MNEVLLLNDADIEPWLKNNFSIGALSREEDRFYHVNFDTMQYLQIGDYVAPFDYMVVDVGEPGRWARYIEVRNYDPEFNQREELVSALNQAYGTEAKYSVFIPNGGTMLEKVYSWSDSEGQYYANLDFCPEIPYWGYCVIE